MDVFLIFSHVDFKQLCVAVDIGDVYTRALEQCMNANMSRPCVAAA